jgi:hypothetical protein
MSRFGLSVIEVSAMSWFGTGSHLTARNQQDTPTTARTGSIVKYQSFFRSGITALLSRVRTKTPNSLSWLNSFTTAALRYIAARPVGLVSALRLSRHTLT